MAIQSICLKTRALFTGFILGTNLRLNTRKKKSVSVIIYIINKSADCLLDLVFPEPEVMSSNDFVLFFCSNKQSKAHRKILSLQNSTSILKAGT